MFTKIPVISQATLHIYIYQKWLIDHGKKEMQPNKFNSRIELVFQYLADHMIDIF